MFGYSKHVPKYVSRTNGRNVETKKEKLLKIESYQMEGYKSLQKLYPLEFYRKFLVHGLRPDARPLDKARKLKVTRGTTKM